MGILRKRESRGDSGAANAQGKTKCISQAQALLFHALEQALGPDVFRGQDTEAKDNNEPPRAGSEDHDQTENEESEPEEDLHEPLSLFQSVNEHRFKSRQAENVATDCRSII